MIVYFDSLDGPAADDTIVDVLGEHRARIQAAIARQIRAKKTPILTFQPDEVIRRRLEVYERETAPVLEFYPQEKIHRVDATMSQIRVLGEIIELVVPLKERLDADHAKDEGPH